MIHYQLQCSQSHEFDGWFNDSASFDKQVKRGLIECPECGGTDISRALMAPAVAKRSALVPTTGQQPAVPTSAPQKAVAAGAPAPLPAQMMAALQRMRAEVEKHCDYVGPAFADEARAMHRGEVEARSIYGETSDEQAESLAEEGISVAKIPWVPRADG